MYRFEIFKENFFNKFEYKYSRQNDAMRQLLKIVIPFDKKYFVFNYRLDIFSEIEILRVLRIYKYFLLQ